MTEHLTEQADPQDFTPLQEAYLQKLMATYQANLHFFHQRFPAIFNKLMKSDLPAPMTVGPDGELTIYSGRFKGSPRDYVDLSKILMDVFENPKTRPRISVTFDYLLDLYNVAPHQDIPYFHTYIEPQYRTELVRRFIDMTSGDTPETQRLTMSDFGDKKLPIAIVFGSGYGWHLDRLVDDWDMRHLVLVDTEVERLNLSLYFVDYVSLYQRFAAKGLLFSVALDEDGDVLADQLRLLIYNNWPPYFVQGAGLFFNDYDSDVVRKLWNKLKTDLWTLYRGWGFLDDEIVGLKQAIENCVDRVPAFTRLPQMPEEPIAFVVGAGPSLDTLVPLLKEYQDRAVIFSCGSAVTALAREGIKPDFHVEVERTLLTCRFLEDPITKEFIKDVPIIALTIMHPGVFELTSTPLMFFKELDLGTNVADFFGEYPRLRSGPTCTNGGVALALKMGFKRIYLAGVDFGFRDEKRHHSRSSIYYDQETEVAPDLMKYVDTIHAEHKEEGAKTAKANFGGEVLSTDIFLHSRDSMAMTLSEHPASKVFNLNDGVFIDNAEPLRPEDFKPEVSVASKQVGIATAMTGFTLDYDADPLQRLTMLEAQMTAVREDVARVLSVKYSNKMDVLDRLAELHHYFFQAEHQATQIFPLMRGSMMHMGRFFYDCVTLCPNDQKAVEFAEFGFELIQRFLGASSEALAQLHTVGGERIASKRAA